MGMNAKLNYRMGIFYPSQHFLLRQWERCIDSLEMNKILKKIEEHQTALINKKTIVIVGEKLLKLLKIKVSDSVNLVIVIGTGFSLVTVFYIKDLFEFFKRSKNNENVILL